MPYNKGDFTQQGVNGDVSALVRLNEKRVMKVVLSSDDENDNCDISGKVYDLLNGTEYGISSGTAPTGTITITENGTGIDVAPYAYADVNVSGGSSDFTTVKVKVILENAGSTPIPEASSDFVLYGLPIIGWGYGGDACLGYASITAFGGDVPIGGTYQNEFDVVLYKGIAVTPAYFTFTGDNVGVAGTPTITGNANIGSDDKINITGDATITIPVEYFS